LVKRLFDMFTIGHSYNVIAVRCLLKLVVNGGAAVHPLISGIVRTVVTFLRNMGTTQINAPFAHYLFEIIAASVTCAHVDVPLIEESVIMLCNEILEADLTEFVPHTFQLIACLLLGYPEGAPLDDFYEEQFGFFIEPVRWQPRGNIPGLAILVRAYCQRLPALVIDQFEAIRGICETILMGGRSHPHGFLVLSSILRYISVEILLPILPHIFELVLTPLFKDEEVTRYSVTFAIFMSGACEAIGTDNTVAQIPAEALQRAIEAWANGLLSFRGDTETFKAVLAGVLHAICQGNLSDDIWFELFQATVCMIGLPAKAFDIVIQECKEEKKDAMQFDTVFSRLIYAERPEDAVHPELKGKSPVKIMATTLADFSHEKPGTSRRPWRSLHPHSSGHSRDMKRHGCCTSSDSDPVNRSFLFKFIPRWQYSPERQFPRTVFSGS
jgi:hypothetical protein